MRVKVYVVDFEIPPRVRKWALRLAVPAVVLSVAAVALAGPLHTWSTGDALNASDLNANFANLQSQITTTGDGGLAPRLPSAFRAVLTKATSVPTSGTVIPFDTVEYDLGGEYSPVTGAFTPKSAGVYTISCTDWFVPDGTAGTFEVVIQKNGANIAANGLQSSTSTGDDGSITPQVTTTVLLADKDTVQCSAGQYTGATQGLDTGSSFRNTFSAARIY